MDPKFATAGSRDLAEPQQRAETYYLRVSEEADAPEAATTPWRVVAGELAVSLAGVAVYLLLRGAVAPGDSAEALRRTEAIIAFETRLGVFHEAAWQSVILDHRWLVEFANAVYLFGMHPVMLLTAIWLCRRSLSQFRMVKHVLLVSACLGCFCYWLLPTAPPRLVINEAHDDAFIDTLHGEAPASVQDMQPPFLVNDYAAIPSYHFAWIALMAAAITTTTRSWVARSIAATFTGLMGWAIVVTGNHLFFDLALGVVAVVLSWAAVLTGSLALRASGSKATRGIPATAPTADAADWGVG